MDVDPRLLRLHRLIDRLERQPASTRREWLLAEARARMVDVETGFKPAAVRAFEDESQTLPPDEPAPPRGANHRPAERPRSEPRAPTAPREPIRPTVQSQAVPPPVPEPTAHVEASAPVNRVDDLLWLDDPAGDAFGTSGDSSDGRGYRRGLRG